MKTLLDEKESNFLRRLHRLDGGTIQDICEMMGVTATAVRQRLVKLQAAGMIDREAVSEGRGRPYFIYRVSEDGKQQLSDNYADLAMILWNEVIAVEEPAVRNRLLSRIEDALVQRYQTKVDGSVLADRVTQLKSALGDRGFDVETDLDSELPILRENSCPYHELAQSDSRICDLEHKVFERVLGTPVSLIQRCIDGHNCCEFQAGEVSNKAV